MSRNDDFEKLIRSLIKQVMKNRQDITVRNDFVYEVAFYTLHSPKLMRMIKEGTLSGEKSSSREESQLAHIIALLALINRTIDLLLMKGNQDIPLILNEERHTSIQARSIS